MSPAGDAAGAKRLLTASRYAGPMQVETAALDELALEREGAIGFPRHPHGDVVVHRPLPRFSFGLRELWVHRHMIRHLCVNTAIGKLRGTYLGWLWIPLRPGIDIFMRAFVFGGLLGVSSGERPYLIFINIGSMGWVFFERASYWGYRGLRFHRMLIERIQAPWLATLVASLTAGVIEASLYGVVAGIAAVYYKITRGSFFITITVATPQAALGFVMLALYAIMIGAWFAPAVDRVRDVRFVLKYIFSILYFVTPVLYAASSIPPEYRRVAELNPLAAPIGFVQNGLLGTSQPTSLSIAVSAIVLAVALPPGLLNLYRAQRAAHLRL